MPSSSPLEAYARELREGRAIGVAETSFYGTLANLLNTIGASLKPRVRCVIHPKSAGAGIPDGGLYAADQLPRSADPAALVQHTIPARGVVEIKGIAEDVERVARGEQVAKYLARYGQVLVTNYRDFVLVGRDASGAAQLRERYQLAPNVGAFWQVSPEQLAQEHEARLTEYLKRVMLSNAPLADPKDVAWFLASYARDARARIEHARLPALDGVRSALEEALGITFQGERGDHFFRSTLIQTLFYGIFSAWVLWSKDHTSAGAHFDWRTAAYYLHVPMIEALFSQVAAPNRLRPLGLMEVLDWTAAALNRIDRPAFFERFEEGLAVQYFYEPFLEAFDPQLRKDLGVWYTPPEIVTYQVARVDAVLRSELGIADGLADPRVHVLDPCCGTGAYLVAVLQQIAATLRAQGGDALLADDLKRAARERVFGFELLPAPFVVAHLQLGLLLQHLGAPLADEGERVGVYLTNALTGWEPPDAQKEQVIQHQLAGMPELQQERDLARHVKRDEPILVILGNPPYSGYAGIAVGEERDLSNAYRTTRRAPAPQGQGLNDLYIRFFRMAERRIVEGSGQGVVCFISNSSWLDGLSFTGMRERYLEAFDQIWIDNLNGDKYKTGKLTPAGQPDPSVFSTPFNPEGIQVGTAISLLVRQQAHTSAAEIQFRHLWGKQKRAELIESIGEHGTPAYTTLTPPLAIGLPFLPAQVEASYTAWPLLPELFPTFSPGVKTSRDLDLVDIDKNNLESRMTAYFDALLDDTEVARIAPSIMTSSARFDAIATRRLLAGRGIDSGYIVRFAYQPFDNRYVYWHPETKLLDEKRDDLFAMFKAKNIFLASRQKAERQNEGTPFYLTHSLPDWHMTRPGSICFPLVLNGASHQQHSFFDTTPSLADAPKANLSAHARGYLKLLDIENPDIAKDDIDLIWMHALAIGYSPAYLTENDGGIRQDWPRIPLPADADTLRASAALGRQVAALLDVEQSAPGVSSGAVRPELRGIGVISRVGGGSLQPSAGDLDVTAGWGHAGQGGVTMPGKGKQQRRDYSADELAAIEAGAAGLGLTAAQARALLGEQTYDIYLNGVAYWKNVPTRVWEYTIGGYQVMKKWLSYRERPLLGRALTVDEAREVGAMARRIAAILLLEPALDANYQAVKASTADWGSVRA